MLCRTLKPVEKSCNSFSVSVIGTMVDGGAHQGTAFVLLISFEKTELEQGRLNFSTGLNVALGSIHRLTKVDVYLTALEVLI